jgi:hypothetical protein
MALVTYKAPKLINIKPFWDSIEASETKSTLARLRQYVYLFSLPVPGRRLTFRFAKGVRHA